MTWVAAFFFTTLGNLALWQTLWSKVEVSSMHGVLFFISLPVFLFCFLNLLLTLVMMLPYLRKILLGLLVIISASCSYFMLSYNILVFGFLYCSLFFWWAEYPPRRWCYCRLKKLAGPYPPCSGG